MEFPEGSPVSIIYWKKTEYFTLNQHPATPGPSSPSAPFRVLVPISSFFMVKIRDCKGQGSAWIPASALREWALGLSRRVEDCPEDQAEQCRGGWGLCRTGPLALMALLLAPKVLAFPNSEDSARSQETSAMLQTTWPQVS